MKKKVKSTAPAAKRTRASKKRSKTKTIFKPRFFCDCMTALAAVIMVGSISAGLTVKLFTPDTRVLGISTKLDSQQILRRLNLERAREGLAPVALDERLTSAAQAKGENMFADSYWAHVNPDGTEPWAFIQAAGYEYQSAGENLARDFADESSLIAAWMASPSHRENIMNADFSDVGLAVLEGQIDGKNVLLVVNLFGQPKGEGALVAQAATYTPSDHDNVLSGQVRPAAIAAHQRLHWWQLATITVVACGMILVLWRLQPKKAFRRTRKMVVVEQMKKARHVG